MKKTYNDKLTVTVLAAVGAVAGIGAAVAYLLSYQFGLYESDIHHFKTGEMLPILIAVCVGAVVLLSVVSGIVTIRRDTHNKEEQTVTSFVMYFNAFMLVAYFILSLRTTESVGNTMVIGVWCAKLSPFVGLLSAVPFVCGASSSFRRSTLHKVTSMLPAVWCILVMFKYYFDQNDFALNDPELMITNLGLAAAILFLTVEARRAMMIDTTKKNIMTACLVTFITLPMAIIRIYLITQNTLSVPSIQENIVLAAIGILGAVRLLEVIGGMKSVKQDYVCLKDRTTSD